LHLWPLKLKVKGQQRYLVDVLAIIYGRSNVSVVASQSWTFHTQQLIEISQILAILDTFSLLSMLQSLIYSSRKPFTTFDTLFSLKNPSSHFLLISMLNETRRVTFTIAIMGKCNLIYSVLYSPSSVPLSLD
jgi:hypothetical protein